MTNRAAIQFGIQALANRTYVQVVPRFRQPPAGEFASVGALKNVGTPADSRIAGSRLATAARTNRSGRRWQESTPGFDWFEHVHVLPRSKIQFGNVVTTATAPFELFNSYRTTVVSFTTFINNSGAGTGIPNLPSLPDAVQPLTSVLDPSSMRLVPVRLSIQVTPAGPPSFDSSMEFDFTPGGALFVFLAGTRVPLVAIGEFETVSETFGFRTDIIEALDGNEQRVSVRKQPRQSFQVTYALDDIDRRRMQAIIFDRQAAALGLPLWHEAILSSAAVSGGAASIPVMGASDIDLRIGGLAVVYSSATSYDVVTISALTGTLVSFATTPLVNSYPVGTQVIPVRICNITSKVSGRRPPVNLEVWGMTFTSLDNDTGALVGDVSGWSSYLGKVLLDDPNVVIGEMSEDFFRRVTVIDNSTGILSTSTRWDRGRRGLEKGFIARSRSEIIKLRKLLLALRGKQISFWIPTGIEDLSVQASLVSGSSTIDIDWIGYTKFIQSREPKRTFKITFTDSTSLIRVVQSSVEISGTVERLTLDTTWPANRLTTEVVRVQFYEMARFDADDVTINYPRAGIAASLIPVRGVLA